MGQPVPLYVLDEPTNDLDLDTIEAGLCTLTPPDP
jgi:ATPase subunit of ABC transporter with duplicated ATPase domains